MAKQQKAEGILKKPLSSHYQVQFQMKGQTCYGTVRHAFGNDKASKQLLRYADEGKLVIDDAIYPTPFIVNESEVTDVEPFSKAYEKYVADAYEAALKRSNALPNGVHVGKIFSIGVADGSAFYEVVRVSGAKCDVEWRGFGGGDRYTDHFFAWGRTGVAVKDVLKYVGRAEGLANLFKEQDRKTGDFFSSLKAGTFVHYHNSFGQYVRCEVVVATKAQADAVNEKRGNRDIKVGSRLLKPIALVGNWPKYELYRIGYDGSVSHDYHAKSVLSGELFQCQASNVFECKDFSRPGGTAGEHSCMPTGTNVRLIDPTKLEPLRLTPPIPTKEQKAQYAAWAVLAEAKSQLEPKDGHKTLVMSDPMAMLKEAQDRLHKAMAVIQQHLGK